MDYFKLRSKRESKYKAGVGGYNCPCCTKGPFRELKPHMRRLTRRKFHFEDKELKYVDYKD